MKGFDPSTSFGPEVARRYDDHLRGDESQTVAFLAGLATDGTALELAVGTGRIALPLSRGGVQVDGIELSTAMVSRLREKDDGERINVVIGDMAAASAPRSSYSLVYLVYNTVYNLLTQDDQVRCFENASRHLGPGGVFVVEAGAPWTWLSGDQFVNVERLTVDTVMLDVNRYNPITQILDESHVVLTTGGIEMQPISCRLISPSEMDLMARIAGLRLVHRWGGWEHEPFTSTSQRHVSVYGR